MIREALLTPNAFSRPQLQLRRVDAIVLHWVGNAQTSADANRRYFESLKDGSRYASAHYVIDRGEIVHCVPDNEVAYHCGLTEMGKYTRWAREKWPGEHPNWYTIGVEHCHPDATGTWERGTVQRSHVLVAGLCLRYGRDPLTDIVLHWTITGKECPRHMVADPRQLLIYRSAIKTIMEA